MIKQFSAKYPSNIALVKYWGKYGNQLPCNASLSLTLSKAFTELTLKCTPKDSHEIELDYYFEGKVNQDFKDRIVKYASQQEEFAEVLKNYALRFDSKNSFPHSAGIASSASAFATVAAVLLKASNQLDEAQFNQEASRLARLGSGSACRSFYGPFAMWGELEGIKQSSNDYAIPIEEIHPNFQSMCDAILIVEDEPKEVSSSVGHSLMNDHPYAKERFKDANKHCQEMLGVLKNGDYEAFISITEREALSLHAMMMTSKDYYMLMKPGTVYIINQIFQFRKATGLPICFTLDAGPNIHLLYPSFIQEKVLTFVEDYLRKELKAVIYDQSGNGGVVLKNTNGAS